MYISIKKAAQKYDFHMDTMRNHLKNMEEGVHYIMALGKVRFNEDKLHAYLTQKENDVEIDISQFLK
jgi:hypothetical protein